MLNGFKYNGSWLRFVTWHSNFRKSYTGSLKFASNLMNSGSPLPHPLLCSLLEQNAQVKECTKVWFCFSSVMQLNEISKLEQRRDWKTSADVIQSSLFHLKYTSTREKDSGEGNGHPLQCSCLENPRDGGAWWAAVYGVAQSQTRLKRLSSSSREKDWQGCLEAIMFGILHF